jgi:hypothetical protein
VLKNIYSLTHINFTAINIKTYLNYRKPKTQKGKRFLESRDAKITENTKSAMFIKGGNTSMKVSLILKELVSFYINCSSSSH